MKNKLDSRALGVSATRMLKTLTENCRPNDRHHDRRFHQTLTRLLRTAGAPRD